MVTDINTNEYQTYQLKKLDTRVPRKGETRITGRRSQVFWEWG